MRLIYKLIMNSKTYSVTFDLFAYNHFFESKEFIITIDDNMVLGPMRAQEIAEKLYPTYSIKNIRIKKE